MLHYFIYGMILFNCIQINAQQIDFKNQLSKPVQHLVERAALFTENKNTDSLAFYSERLFTMTQQDSAVAINFFANLYKGKFLLEVGELLQAMPYFEKACKIANYNDQLLIETSVYTDLSHIYNKNLGHTNKHLEVLLRVFNYYKDDHSNFLNKNKNLIALGDLFIENENYKQADVYLEKALFNCENTKHTNTDDIKLIYGKIYNAKAFLKHAMEKYEESLEHLLMAKDKMIGLQKMRDVEVVDSNIGYVYLKLNQFDKAKEIFLKNIHKTQYPILALGANINLSIISFLEAENPDTIISTKPLFGQLPLTVYYKYEKLIDITKAYLSKQKYQMALATINDCLGILGENMLKQKSVALDLRSKILEKMNLYDALIDNLNHVAQIKDTLNIKNSDFQLNYLNTKLMLANTNKNISEQNLKIQYLSEKNAIKNILNALSFVLVILIIVFARFYIIKNKRETAKELELIELEDHYRKKQVTDFALHLNEKNAILNELKQKIKSLDIDKKIKNEVSLLIQDKIKSSNSKVELEKASNEINKDFYKKLSSLHPNLSEKDKELLYLIRLNYSSKQICEVFNIEKVTVNNYRYRLRKKLNLEKGANLATYVHSI
ncbi:MAG: hypothetical protein HRT68_07455 [Flavobacteriaceae bacterium]|nr:hypothetical protein [Flavobacteriaceae bacterium]